MEIDEMGQMWVVDVGRVNLFGGTVDNSCPSKLLVVDLGAHDERAQRPLAELGRRPAVRQGQWHCHAGWRRPDRWNCRACGRVTS